MTFAKFVVSADGDYDESAAFDSMNDSLEAANEYLDDADGDEEYAIYKLVAIVKRPKPLKNIVERVK